MTLPGSLTSTPVDESRRWRDPGSPCELSRPHPGGVNAPTNSPDTTPSTLDRPCQLQSATSKRARAYTPSGPPQLSRAPPCRQLNPVCILHQVISPSITTTLKRTRLPFVRAALEHPLPVTTDRARAPRDPKSHAPSCHRDISAWLTPWFVAVQRHRQQFLSPPPALTHWVAAPRVKVLTGPQRLRLDWPLPTARATYDDSPLRHDSPGTRPAS